MSEAVQVWWFDDFFQNSNVIEDWRVSELSEEGRTRMDALLKNTSKTKNHLEWGARDLKGTPKKEGIFELKFIADKKAYRLAFIFQPERRVLLLGGFYHKQGRYYPQEIIETVRKRAKDFREEKAGKVERKIKFDQ